MEKATIGGGCFWCLEAVYQDIDGVSEVVSGYAGGSTANPTYRQVCSGSTGHAEVVQIAFDPGVVSYQDLIEVFFTIHNPTTKNRQGADIGTQYRSIILYHDQKQRETAQSVVDELEAQNIFSDPIVTEIEPLETFYEAEAKHQDYYKRNPGYPYCQAVIEPKLSKLRKKHAAKLKA